MPIQNGKYVSPTWANDSPPAIDAAELNAWGQRTQALDARKAGNGLTMTDEEIAVRLSTQQGNAASFGSDGGLFVSQTGGGGGDYTAGNGVSISGGTISARLSTQQNNAATFGPDGGLYVPSGGGSGKRYASFVIGTSTNGWTAEDCDYLCDGTDDNVEINDAISSLPTTGGEVVILPGTYNISATIRGGASGGYGPVLIHGAGSHSRSVTLKWTGPYIEDSEPSTSHSTSSNDSMLVLWNGCVENVVFDMSDGSQPGGNIGCRLGTLGIAKECYFMNCPTSVVCSGIGSKFLNSYLDVEKYGCYFFQGYMAGCYINMSRTGYGVYSEQTGTVGEVLLVGNIFEAPYNSNANGV